MILADIHTHSSFSGDSDEPMENMVKEAISQNLKVLCITEHMDFDFPPNEIDPLNMFILDTDSYLKQLTLLKDKYRDSIELLFGVELGLQPHLAKRLSEYVKSYAFDFIIGSEHVTDRKDPYYPAFFEGRSEYDAYCSYFSDIITNLKSFNDFDTLGHMDYVVRYGPNTNLNYSYSRYSDYLDEILKLLITNEIGLEVNSGGYKYNLGEPNPCKDIIRRYKELGGEIITIGSDAHDTSRITSDFDKIETLLKSCGFNHYSIFKNRKVYNYKF